MLRLRFRDVPGCFGSCRTECAHDQCSRRHAINMRIAVLTNIFPTSSQPWRGHSVYQTVKRLAQLADVEVFAPYIRYPGPLRRFEKRGKDFDPEYQPEGVRTHYFYYPAVPRVSRKWNGAVIARTAADRVRQFQPD